MPFQKVKDNDYTSPSGRHFNSAQVKLYYANGGHFPGEAHREGGTVKGPSMARSKSYGTFGAAYAAGGPVLGRTRDFMKEPDTFRTDKQNQDYGSKGSPAKRTGDKCLTPVKPKG
jgi:hypothetical protein